jgi:glycosyltransferase involved in cell wall biosynthesis
VRILQLTAGTGGFYCGTCIRDNALVAGLIALGHDAEIVPLYLPIQVEEDDRSADNPLFFGGVHVYLRHRLRWARNLPDFVDRLLDGRGLLRWAGKRQTLTDGEGLTDLTLSMLEGPEGGQARDLEKLVAWLEAEGRPDLVILSNGLLAGFARTLRERLGVPVVCTLQGEHAFVDAMPEIHQARLWKAMGEQVRAADMAIAVSEWFRDVMIRRLQLDPSHIRAVANGIVPDSYAPVNALPPRTLGYLARFCPEKGPERVVDAFLRLRKQPELSDMRLHMAGAMTPDDEKLVARIRRAIAAAGASDFVRIQPNATPEEKRKLLHDITVLCVPALYGEAFGLYNLEALACGVPIVAPRHAAHPEVVEATGGGLLFEPNNNEALDDSLRALLLDADRARALGEAGRAAVLNQFTHVHMAERVLAAVEGHLEQADPAARSQRP